jgi:predicted lipoprotein
MKRTVVTVLSLAAMAALLWLFPLVHIVRLSDEKPPASFDAAKFAKDFWTEKLMPALANAADATTVLPALRENPTSAAQQYGRKVGISRSRFYFVRGTGTIVSIEPQGIGLSLGNANEAEIVLETGLLFGNAVRDATGLTTASNFPNSQAFNDVSTELNHLVETQVIPSLKQQAQIGRRVQFVGSGEVRADATELMPLKLVPLEVHFE